MKTKSSSFKKKFLVSALFALLNSLCLAQPQSKLWMVPQNQIGFPSLNVSQLPTPTNMGPAYTGAVATNACNVMHDVNGKLLFFIIDGTVYDKDGLLIGEIFNGLSINTGGGNDLVKGTTEWLIIPVPDEPNKSNCNLYYLVAGNYDDETTVGGKPHAYYITLDLNLRPGVGSYGNPLAHGDFVGQTQTATSLPGVSGSFSPKASCMNLAVTPLRSDGKRFLYINYYGGGLITRYNVTGSGIAPDVSQYSYQAPSPYQSNKTRCEMEIVPIKFGNYRIAFPYMQDLSTPTSLLFNNIVYVADINGSTGDIIPSTEKLLSIPSDADVHGIEFSSDGRFIYIAHTNPLNPPISYLDFADLSLPTPAFIPLSNIVSPNIANPADFQFSQIEMGSDGKLYFAAANRMAELDVNFNLPPNGATWNNNVSGLPGVNISSAYFSPSNVNSIRLLNDQIDDEQYQNYQTGQCCIINTAFTKDTYIANTNNPFPFNSTTQVWTPNSNPFGGNSSTAVTVVTIRDSLVIPAGFNITIKGMRFEFAPRTFGPDKKGAFVAVRSSVSGQGGRLNLDAKTIFTSYNSCGKGMWEGVWVWGRGNLPQGNFSFTNQGVLFIKNNSEIDNAYIGALAGKYTNDNPIGSNPTLDINYSGGIIRGLATLSQQPKFINNMVGVEFSYYTYPSISSFSEVDFETNDKLNDPNAMPGAFAVLTSISGVSFYGCNFKNVDPNYNAHYLIVQDAGVGILALNSSFKVDAICQTINCTGNIPNVFSNLTYGITGWNYTVHNAYINRNKFLNNYRGILLSNYDYCKILRNRFEVLQTTSNFNLQPYGLHLDFTKGFKVEENYFTPSLSNFPSNPPINGISWGAIVNQSNPNRNCQQHDEIYNNVFDKMFIGIQAQGNNSEKPYTACYPTSPTTPNNIGLEFLCNDFNNATRAYDILLRDYNPGSGPIVSGNVAYQQGNNSNVLYSARNQFSQTCPNPDSDFGEQVTTPESIVYSVFNYPSNPRLDPSSCKYPLVSTIYTQSQVFSHATHCPTKISMSPMMIQQELTNLKNQENVLAAKIDGGKTNYLISQINSSVSEGQLKNLLDQYAPYLSDAVLIAVINRNPALSPGILKDIIISNSPVSSSVMQAVNNISLPKGTIKDIGNAQNGESASQILQAEISYIIGIEDYYFNQLIGEALNDTTNTDPVDSLIALVKRTSVSYKNELLAKLYLSNGDLIKANLAISDLSTELGINSPVYQYLDILAQLQASASSYNAVATNTALAQQVSNIALQTDYNVSAAAGGLLKHVLNKHYNEYVAPLQAAASSARETTTTAIQNVKLSENRIYPNPNNGNMIFEYSLQTGDKGELVIYDLSGRKVRSYELKTDNNKFLINEPGFENGIYICHFVVNDKSVYSNKLVIMK